MSATSTDAASAALVGEHVFDYEALLEPPVAIGAAQHGERVFYAVRGGRISGPRLNAEILSGGGDWALTGADGWTRIDVRGQCRTEDGALLYVVCDGVIEPSAAVARAMRTGGETAFEDQYWRMAMRVETAHPRHRWLTQTLLVGRGRVCAGPGVAYEVFRV